MQKLKGKRRVFAIFLLPVVTYQETSEKGLIHLQKKTTENEKENEEFVGTSLMREKIYYVVFFLCHPSTLWPGKPLIVHKDYLGWSRSYLVLLLFLQDSFIWD